MASSVCISVYLLPHPLLVFIINKTIRFLFCFTNSEMNFPYFSSFFVCLQGNYDVTSKNIFSFLFG